ncbi:hypothetical protein LBMAG52_38830 [Planctomycetia bacterium]|nr:hypothetical protein LBMAG52_38830 [Planctomycetia bacterium]
MKSDATSVLEQPPVPREKRPLNPWLLVLGVSLGFAIFVVSGLLLLAPKQSLSIIVHKGHEFEFFAKPPELPEDKPMP